MTMRRTSDTLFKKTFNFFYDLFCNLINIVASYNNKHPFRVEKFTCVCEGGEKEKRQESIFWNHLPYIVQITNKAIFSHVGYGKK